MSRNKESWLASSPLVTLSSTRDKVASGWSTVYRESAWKNILSSFHSRQGTVEPAATPTVALPEVRSVVRILSSQLDNSNIPNLFLPIRRVRESHGRSNTFNTLRLYGLGGRTCGSVGWQMQCTHVPVETLNCQKVRRHASDRKTKRHRLNSLKEIQAQRLRC